MPRAAEIREERSERPSKELMHLNLFTDNGQLCLTVKSQIIEDYFRKMHEASGKPMVPFNSGEASDKTNGFVTTSHPDGAYQVTGVISVNDPEGKRWIFSKLSLPPLGDMGNLSFLRLKGLGQGVTLRFNAEKVECPTRLVATEMAKKIGEAVRTFYSEVVCPINITVTINS